jgi:hypothetical protein
MKKNKNNFVSPLRRVFGGIFSRRDPAELFVIIMALSITVWTVFYLCIGNGRFSDMFFLRTGDLFMDYFNSIRDAAQGPGVYTERNVIYPPLANLIFLALAQFAPHGYNDTPFFDRKNWLNYSSAIILFVLIAIACALIVYTVFRENINRKKLLAIVFGFFCVFNASTLYMIERGNVLILCLISIAVFAFTYNSESKTAREIGIIALAVAAALKLYPALFMWLFISDKKYKELARCLAYFSVLMILPSFFFGGPKCIITLLKNTFGFSAKKGSSSSAITVIAKYTHIPTKLISLGAYVWCLINLISFMASPFLKDERWKSFIKGTLLILTAPPLTSQYVWSFFLIALVLLCNFKPKADKKDFVFLVPMFIPFLFIILRFNYFLTINTVLVYVCTAILSGICVVDTIMSFGKTRLTKKNTVN